MANERVQRRIELLLDESYEAIQGHMGDRG
jgi:hypothetical protein